MKSLISIKKTTITCLLAALTVCSVFTACTKKNDTIVFEGNIYDNQLNINVQNAKVSIYSKYLDSGVYNQNFKVSGSATTDEKGNYSIEIDKHNFTEVYIEVEKEGYLASQQNIDIDYLGSNNTVSTNLTIIPLGEITLKVRNQTQYSNTDYISYQFTNQSINCESCCNNLPNYGIGKTFYAEQNCNVIGNSWVKIFWGVEIAGSSYSKTDSVFCNAFENTVFEIVY